MVEELADVVDELATVDPALGDEADMDDDVAAEETIVFVDSTD